MLYRSGKHDQRLCVSEPLYLSDKLIQFHGIGKQNLKHHGIIAGDTVALNDISNSPDIRIELDRKSVV